MFGKDEIKYSGKEVFEMFIMEFIGLKLIVVGENKLRCMGN